MSAGEPRSCEGFPVGGPPQRQDTRKASRQQRCERLWQQRAIQSRGSPSFEAGSERQIEPEADHYAIPAALEKDASQLGGAEQQVIGPLEHERKVGNRDVHGLDQREARGERERRRRRIAGAKLDDRASKEIA